MRVRLEMPRSLVSACSIRCSRAGTSSSGLRNTMLPLASTESTASSPSRSNTPRSLSFVMFVPLGAMPRRSAAYWCMVPTVPAATGACFPLPRPLYRGPGGLRQGTRGAPDFSVVPSEARVDMNEVTIVGGGPTGLMLAGELALAGVDVVVLERRPTPDLVGTRARGVHARTIEIFDQRGIADRFLEAGWTVQVLSFADTALDVAGLPSRHPYTLALSQSHIERILRGWVEELGAPIHLGLEVTGFAQDDAGV